MKIGYLKNLGKHELEQAATKWQDLHANEEVTLEPIVYDEIEAKIQNGEVDAVLVNSRNDIYRSLQSYPVGKVALVGLVQAGNFNKYQQTVELNELKNMPCIMVSSVDEEKSEYHYLKDVLKLKNDLLGVETLGEAILMVESGSGYLIMNEMTASYVDDDQIQELFLLRDGTQMREKYVLLAKPDDEKIAEFSEILKCLLN